MKRLLTFLVLLTGCIVSALAADPVKPLPPQAISYLNKAVSKTSSEYDAKHIKDNLSFSTSFYPISKTTGYTDIVYDATKPEEGVQVWFIVRWFNLLDGTDLPTSQEISDLFNVGEKTGAVAFGAACALHRGCPLTIGFKPDRFKETGLFSALTLDFEEVVNICSKR